MYININDAIYMLDNFLISQLYNYKIIKQNHFMHRTSKDYIENKLVDMLLDNNLITIDLNDKPLIGHGNKPKSRYYCVKEFFSNLFK